LIAGATQLRHSPSTGCVVRVHLRAPTIESTQRMVEEAEALEADAIINVRFTTS